MKHYYDMESDSAALISSEKTPLISSPEGTSPKTHGSTEQTGQGDSSSSIPSTPTVTFGPHKQLITCPHCKEQVSTTTKYRANVDNKWLALLLLILCWPCTCSPYCCNSCKSVHHYCSNCKKYLGQYNNL